MRISALLLLVMVVAASGCATSSSAQEPAADPAPAEAPATGPVAAPTSDDPRPTSVLQGVYTQGQAERGTGVFRASCGACHGRAEFTSAPFLLTWTGQALGSFYGHIVDTMPLENPGRLSPQEYADVVAYILQMNEYPTGQAELPGDREILNGIRFERRP